MSVKFHEALGLAMRQKSYSAHELSRGISVPKARVEAWMAGTETPTRQEFGRVCVHLPKMRPWKPAFTPAKAHVAVTRVEVVPASAPPGAHGPGDYGADSFGGSDFPETRVVVDPPAPRERSATFGEALRKMREDEEISQEELGAMVGVTGQAVSQWETGEADPVRDNYKELIGLFPELLGEPEPAWRPIPKPTGGAGAQRPERVTKAPDPPKEAPPAPEPPPAAPPPVDAAERLLTAFVDVFGEGSGWGLSIRPGEPERGEEAWVVLAEGKGAQHEAQGPTVSACYRRLYEVADAELERLARIIERRRAMLKGAVAA